MPGIDPDSFVAAVKPLLEARDTSGLLTLLKSRWNGEQIVALLSTAPPDARKVAALALSLVGCAKCLPHLTRTLQDPDPVVNQMAEHAMWSIWFRLGTPPANCEVHRGVQAMEAGEHERAIVHFTRAIEQCPQYAEAYNQRATALYLMERFADAARDAEEAVRLNPDHFGAWAGLGHCRASLGQLPQAITAYRRALRINPNLECLAEAIQELQSTASHDH
jgi:tetratricopeptide (TPR) repeat protein